VNTAVAEMDKVTQSTAASAEESAAASEELNAQAEQMKVFVEDLVRVVGGNVDGSRSVHTSAISHAGNGRKAAGHSHLSLKAPVKKTVSQGVFKAKGKTTPEEIIPMGDGQFKDF
jgi:methyl-accepting chemotaxis protein